MTSGPLPAAPTTNSALVWDAENRLVSATVGATTKTTLYDAQSRRIAETSGTATTLYLYDRWNCIAEYQLHNSSFNLHTFRLWGMDLSGSMQGAGGVGGLLCESQISNSQISNYYPTYDGNGNISEYFASNGSVAAHFEYDQFGNAVVNTDTLGLFSYRFSTKPLDSETGLYYYGYRYHDPLTGRWPSRDPIEENGGLSLYGLVKNGPINWVDILGLSKCCATDDEINAKIDEGGQEALQKSKDDQAARQKVEDNKVKGKSHPATAPFYEWGGKVCCKDKELYLSDVRTDNLTDNVYLEKTRCKEGDDAVGAFHNHPNNTPPSRPDKNIARRGKPNKFGPDGKPVYDPTKDSIPPGIPIGATGSNGETNIFDPNNGNPNSFPYPPTPKS